MSQTAQQTPPPSFSTHSYDWLDLDELFRRSSHVFLRSPCRRARQLMNEIPDSDVQKRYAQLSKPKVVSELLSVFNHMLRREKAVSNAVRILQSLASVNHNQNPVTWPPDDPYKITKVLEHLIRQYIDANLTSITVKGLGVKGTAELMLNYANLTLSLGNERGWWRIPLLTDVSYVAYPENPLTRAYDSGHLRFMNRVAHAFLERLRQQPDLQVLPQQVRLGIVTWSLMTESLITHPSTLLKVTRKLCALSKIGFLAERMSISLRDHPKLPERWLTLSPITSSLVIRTRLWNIAPPSDKKALQAALLAFLERLDIRPVFCGLNSWCQAALAMSLGKVPALILSHRNGKVQSFAPYLETMERLLPHAGPLGLASNDVISSRSGNARLRNYSEDIRWVRQTLNLQSKSASNVLPHLQNALANPPTLRPVIAALLHWCVDTITPDGQRVQRSPYQMLARFDSIARHLVLLLDDEDIESLSREERARIYEEVKERAISESNRGRISASLHAFEKWLVANGHVHDGGLLDDDELFGDRQDRHIGVNAHMISIDDYLKARNALIELGQDAQLHPAYRERAHLAALMLVLGFRLGLRWAEAVGVRHIDVAVTDTGQPIKLVIQPHHQRTLKTLNARRTLPLSSLLDTTELDLIQSQLSRPGATAQSFLISRKQDMKTPLDTPKLREMVVRAIRTSAANEYLRYHHLRHSFANWMLLAFAASQWRLDLGHLFNGQSKTVGWLADAKRRFTELSPAAVNDNHPGFMLSQLIGHGSLGTTLYHYVHILDLLSGLYLEQRHALRYSPTNLSFMMALPAGTLKYTFYKSDKKPRWGALCVKHLLKKEAQDGGVRVLLDLQTDSHKLSCTHDRDIAQALAPLVLNPWNKSKIMGARWLVAIPILLEHSQPSAALPHINAMLGQRLKQSTLDRLWTLLQNHPCLRLPALQPKQWEALTGLAKGFKRRIQKQMQLNYPVFVDDQVRRSRRIDKLIETAICSCRPMRSTGQIKTMSTDRLIWKFTAKSVTEAKEVIQLLKLMSDAVEIKTVVPSKAARYRIRKEHEFWRRKLGLSPKARMGVEHSNKAKVKSGSDIKIYPACGHNMTSNEHLILYLLVALYTELKL